MSPMSSDIGGLDIYCILYTPPMILNGLFNKPSNITGYIGWFAITYYNIIVVQ